MRKLAFQIVLIALLSLCLVGPAQARRGGIAVGMSLDTLFPLDKDMYGEGMLDNEWSRDLSGVSYDYSGGEPQYYTPGRPSFVIGPALHIVYGFRFGLGIEITERFHWLYYQPNSEIDVGFSHMSLPTLLTFRYQFMFGERDRWQPYIGAGVGAYYMVTSVAGKDIEDKRANPDYTGEEDDDEPMYLFKQRSFERSGWEIGYQGVLGLDFYVSRRLCLTAAAAYETVEWESVNADLIMDSDDTWHWEERPVNGDAGGVLVQLGVGTKF